MTSRAVGYVRVSDESQVEGLSLDAQRREIARYCAAHGHDLVAVYADEGVSARTEHIERRPALARLLKDAALARFDVVVVHTIDRWSRNVGVQREALQKLGHASVGFASVSENFDFTSASGKLMLTMIGGFSEFFSDQLSVHISKAKREQAERGLTPGPIPFGYVRLDSGSASPQPHEAEAVLTVFRMRARGASHGETAMWLNAHGFRTRTGRLFTSYATKDMTNNAFYTGTVRYKELSFAGSHPPIISAALFRQVQGRRLTPRGTRSPRRTVGALRGLVTCSQCGSPIHAEMNRHGAGRYRERHGIDCRTNGRTVTAKIFDDQLAEIMASIVWERGDIERVAAEAATGTHESEAVLQAHRKRLARAYADGGLDEDEYERRLAAIDLAIANANPGEIIDPAEAAEALEDFATLWGDATSEQRRRLLAPLLKSVYVDLDTQRIVALEAAPEFSALLKNAATRASARCEVLPAEEGVGWWRRGRIELPVQRASVRDVLRA